MKNQMKKILFPNGIIGFLFFNLGFGILIYVFCNHLEETPLAYMSYLLSFYVLVIFCIWFYKACKFSNQWVKKSRMYQVYQNNTFTVTKITLYISFIFNLTYGVLKFGLGIYYTSWWFTTFAIYYLLLCFMKLSLVKNISNQEKEYQKLKHTGVILLFLNLVLIGIIILIIEQDQIIHYNGFLIYLVALYDFYLLIRAIIHVIQYRKSHGPIIASSKCINLTVAMISMISLEVAMIYQFGNNDGHFKLVMTAYTGFGVCFINSCMAIYMIIKANNNLKR